MSLTRLDEFLQLVDTTNGRDHSIRLVFFLCRYLQAKESLKDRETSQVYANVAQNLDLTMKVLRFTRNVALIRALYKSFFVSPSTASVSASPLSSLESLLSLLDKLFILSSLTTDNAIYLARMGVWKGEPSVIQQVGRASAYSWLGDIVCNALLQLIKLQTLSATPVSSSTTSSALLISSSPSSALLLTSSLRGMSESLLAAQRSAALRSLGRGLLLDLPVAFNSLGWTGSAAEEHFSLLGALSALSAIYDSWPSVKTV